jgi:hypothetical protein
VMVGAEHAVILHEARRPPARCQGAPLATVIPVPVPAALPVPSTPPECFPEEEDTTGRIAQTGRLERIGDVPVFLGCSCDPDPVNGCACGVTAPPGAFGRRSFYMGGSHTTTGGLGVDLAVNGDVAYMAADVDDTGNGRIAFLGHRINLAAPAEDRPRWRQIAPEPSAAVRHGLRIEIVENLPDRTVILYGSANAPRATRVVMGADGLREGAAETVDWPVVPPPAASVISDRERGAPPFVRLVTSDAMRPITGVNDAVGAFSPALIEVDGAHVLFWSEGLGDRHAHLGRHLERCHRRDRRALPGDHGRRGVRQRARRRVRRARGGHVGPARRRRARRARGQPGVQPVMDALDDRPLGWTPGDAPGAGGGASLGQLHHPARSETGEFYRLEALVHCAVRAPVGAPTHGS